MPASRLSDIGSRPTAVSALEVPGFEPDRREVDRRASDRVFKWIGDNFFKLLTTMGALFVLLGIRMEGAPQDLARLKAATAAVDSATIGRVVKLEDGFALLRDNTRDLKAAVDDQRYLLCYILEKQDPGALRAIKPCAGVRAP